MSKSWLVARHEIVSNVRRRSWILVTFGVPLIVALVLFGRSLLMEGAPISETAESSPASGELHTEGYVDASGVLDSIPDDLRGTLIPYPEEQSAQLALQAGDIEAYYIIPEDYVRSGDVTYVDPDFGGFIPEGQSWVIRRLLLLNLLNGDTELAARVTDPTDLTVTALSDESGIDVESGWQFTIPYATAMILYFMIIMSASLLRNSFGNERKNQVMEVLMLSVPPQQMFMGKVVGLAIVGLLQTLVWATLGYAVVRLGGQALSLPAGLEVPASLVVWMLVYFVLGYTLYATVLAGLGALTGPNEMGSASADIVVIWPLIIPLFFIWMLISQPNGIVPLVLSFFPPTAPVAMMTRLATGAVPAWQPALAAVMMLLSAFLVVRAVSRVFRAQILLTGKPFSVRQYFAVLLGQS
jgi:ABC-2 type transport system permease protein